MLRIGEWGIGRQRVSGSESVVRSPAFRREVSMNCLQRPRNYKLRLKAGLRTIYSGLLRIRELAWLVVRLAVQLLHFIPERRPIILFRIRKRPGLTFVIPIVRS